MTRTAYIIEDDALIAFEIEDILTALGFDVLGMAATEDTAVSAVAELQPDLLLVDVRLAKGDGISAVARIGRQHTAQVVYVTGNRDEVRRRDAGAICVNKPFNQEMIERAIRTAFTKPSGTDPEGGRGSSGSLPPDEDPSSEGGPSDEAAPCRKRERHLRNEDRSASNLIV